MDAVELDCPSGSVRWRLTMRDGWMDGTNGLTMGECLSVVVYVL